MDALVDKRLSRDTSNDVYSDLHVMHLRPREIRCVVRDELRVRVRLRDALLVALARASRGRWWATVAGAHVDHAGGVVRALPDELAVEQRTCFGT